MGCGEQVGPAAPEPTGALSLLRVGGVGYNNKTELYFLEKDETLKADLYLKILEETLLPVKKQLPWSLTGRWSSLYITQNNDSKHYNDNSRAVFKRNNIILVGCYRHDINGQPDKVPGPGGAL